MPEAVGLVGPDESKRTARAMLAAALLGKLIPRMPPGWMANPVSLVCADYDLDSTDSGPSANAQTSAMLAPLRHLLIQHPPPQQEYYQQEDEDDQIEPERPSSRASGWFGRRASTVMSGGAPSDRSGRPKRDKRASTSSVTASASAGQQPDRRASSTSEYSLPSPVGFDRRQSLASGYGTHTNAAVEGSAAAGGASGNGQGSEDGQIEDEERLADEWGLTSILAKVGATRPTTPGGSLLPLPRVAPVSEADETRSAPDLDHAHAHTLPSASTSAADSGEGPGARRPRITILERKPGQALRPHTMLESGKLDFPDFNFAAYSGGAQDDPLINPARRGSLPFSAAHRSQAGSPLAPSPRPLSPSPLSALHPSSYHPEASWRSSSPLPSALGSGQGEGEGEGAGERARRVSTFSLGPTKFTSRHDPAMIALAKAEIEKERPHFTDKTAGAPPRIVLMPAPLAGRAPSPPPRIRAEGPESESEPDEGDEEGAAEAEPLKRPPGALYGRSLLDVMAERQAQIKGKQRQYVRAQDGRATMHDWAESPAGQKLLESGGDAAEAGEEGDGASAHRVPRSKSTMSMFGPDLLYQKEMAHKRILDAIEAKERAEREELAKAEEDRRSAKEDKKRRWGGKKKKVNTIINASETSYDHQLSPVQPLASSANTDPADPADPYAAFDRSGSQQQLNRPSTPPRLTHALAPSISLPRLGSPESPNTGWNAVFVTPDSPPAVRKGWDVRLDVDGNEFMPRPEDERAGLAPPSTRASSRSPSRVSSPGLSASVGLASRAQSAESLGLPPTPHSGQSARSDWTARSRPETVSAASEEPLAWRYGQAPPRLEQTTTLDSGDEAPDPGSESDSSDELPLGLRRAAPKFDDEDEAPLGLLHGGHTHHLAPANDDDEEDLPLGFKHQDAHFHQQEQYRWHAQMQEQMAYEMAVAQQIQQTQAVMAAHAQQQNFFAMQLAQQQMAAAYEGSVLGGGMVGMGAGAEAEMLVGGVHPGESVDRWRREISG